MTGLLSLAALILAVIALRRSAEAARLAQRVLDMEAQLLALRSILQPARDEPSTPRQSVPLPAAEPTTESAPERPSLLAPKPAVSPAPPPSLSPPAAPVPAPLVSPAAPEKAPPAASRPPAFDIDWEQWIGVRGAAVVGGIVLAMAGVFLFRYSIEHGLIPPWLRVTMGLVAGAACIGGSERWLRQRYAQTANAVAGGGVVILYASLWAAHGLYGLVRMEPVFGSMILVTATCCALSWRHDSLVIALIGLIGGFLTPLLLATGSDRPLGLFTYVLLLDVGLLYMANRRSWPALTLLSLAGTFLYQAGWIITRMGPDRAWLGIGILTVFALVFAVAGRRGARREDPLWLVTQAAGVLLPFGFAIYFAADMRLTPHLYPLAAMLAILSAAASWIGRVERLPRVGIAAAAATVGVVAMWIGTHTLTTALAWETALLCVLLATCFHLFVEWDPEVFGWDGPAPASLVANYGFFLFLLAAAAKPVAGPWPWIAAWVALAALQLRHGTFKGMELLNLAAAAVLGVALAALSASETFRVVAEVGSGIAPDPRVYLAVLVSLAVAFQLVGLLPAEKTLRLWRERGAASLALLLLLSFLTEGLLQATPPMVLLGGMALLGALAGLAATRMPDGLWLLAAAAATALVQSAWCFQAGRISFEAARGALLIQLATAQLFAAWPFLFTSSLRRERWAWNAAALTGPLWFLSLRRLFELTFTDAYIGVLPLMFGALALVSATKVRELWPADQEWRQTRLAWFLTVAMGFVTVAIPLQLDRSWITVGWALQGAAVIYIWQRINHPGLKYFALALFVAVTIRLVGNPAVLGYYPRGDWRIVNWLLYTYLVPAAALLWSAVALSRHELSRAMRWEQDIYRYQQPVGALVTGFAAVAIIFVWINLAIADWFATGPFLQLRFDRMAARDLTTSIAWAAYGLVLLAAGVRFASTGVRWVSLGLMMVTIVKVFLYDLGELGDLYRVASLLGLAVSLLVVSVAYQRFVLRKPSEESP